MDFHVSLDFITLLNGFLIFLARVVDVSLGTLRTISIVQGRTRSAFCLGFVEIIVWLAVITTVVNEVLGAPVLALFYALGFATGNVVGILLERRLISGPIVLRVITGGQGLKMRSVFEQEGFSVISFHGEGTVRAKITELNVFCRRRDLKRLINAIRKMDPDAVYITEQAGGLAKILRPTMQKLTGWRATLKRK